MEAVALSLKEISTYLPIWRKTNHAVLIRGEVGVGKSETIVNDAIAYSKKINRTFVHWKKLSISEKLNLIRGNDLEKYHIFFDIRTALIEPSDLLGLPFTNGDDVTLWKPAAIFKVLSYPNTSATVFFDEFNQGSRMVQNASYQIFLDHCIGEIYFSQDTFIVAAGNRVEDGAFVTPMADPAISRLVVCDVIKPNVKEWIDYMKVITEVPSEFVGYLLANPDSLHNHSRDRSEEKFSDHRAWSRFIDIFKEVNSRDFDPLYKLSATSLGMATATKFVAHIQNAMTYNIDDFFKNPKKVKELESLKVDILYSVISNMVSITYAEMKKGDKKITETFLTAVANFDSKEYLVFSIKMFRELCKNTQEFLDVIMESKVYDKLIMNRISDVMNGD